jgi:hypothetical protein
MQNPYPSQKSEMNSLEEYFKQVSDSYVQLFFVGGKLRPFDLRNDSYQWILYPVILDPGNYRLGINLKTNEFYKPVSAYGMIFPPGEKAPLHPVRNSLGYGFQITPAIATIGKFLPYQNTTEFKTNFDGTHQIGVTTAYWTDEVAFVMFELMLLKKKSNSEIYRISHKQ